MQRAARHVQRNVRRVDHTVQQHQKLRNNVFDIIGHVNLIAVQLDFIFLNFKRIVHFREVKHASQVEREVDIQVNPEHRCLTERVQLLVEIFVIFIRQVSRLLFPERIGVVDDIINFYFFRLFFLAFALFNGFGFCAKFDRNRQKAAIFMEQFGNFVLRQIRRRIIADVQNDVRTPLLLVVFFDHILRAAIAAPGYALCTILVRFGYRFHATGNHKCRVES